MSILLTFLIPPTHTISTNQGTLDKWCNRDATSEYLSISPGAFTGKTLASGRQYCLWVPESHRDDKPSPLVMSYHGGTKNIQDQIKLDALTDPGFNTDHVVVYMQGSLDPGKKKSTWQGVPNAPDDDMEFTSQVLDEVESIMFIDRTRIYATGKSDGGGLVNLLACHPVLSKRFAAFAPVSGAYYIDVGEDENKCHPESIEIPCAAFPSPSFRPSFSPSSSGTHSSDAMLGANKPAPILIFHGGNDTTIKYEGGWRRKACLPAIKHFAREWARRYRSYGQSTMLAMPGTEGGVERTFANGLATFTYDGDNIPHDWPSTFPNPDNEGQNLAAFNATTKIMKFFRSHSLV